MADKARTCRNLKI